MVASAKLSPQTQERLLHIVESGEYESADELVIAALDLLEEKKKADRLDAKLEAGLASLARGEGVLYTQEYREQSLKEIMKRYEAGERADPEYAFE
jgi:putative addiction module CopG family antidote